MKEYYERNYCNEEKMERYLTDGYKIMVCGSYRREVEMRYDVLVYHPHKDIIHNNYFQIFISYQEDACFLVDSLTPNVNKTKYMGMCQLSNKHRVRQILDLFHSSLVFYVIFHW